MATIKKFSVSLPITASLQVKSSQVACQKLSLARTYATQNSLGGAGEKSATPNRRQITVASDDGRIRWGDLSTKEKAARTTQQSFNFVVIVAGVVMTAGVGYLLFSDVFSPNSRTVQFNRAVDRIRQDIDVQRMLGDGKNIRAFGEASWNRWTRNRPIASTTTKDKIGTEHIHMHFHVEGPLGSGIARVHMAKTPDNDRFEYVLLAVDVPGHQRIFLENAENAAGNQKSSGRMFGVKWW